MEVFLQKLTAYLIDSKDPSIIEKTSKLINRCDKSEFDFTLPCSSEIELWKKCAGPKGQGLSFDGLINLERSNCEPRSIENSTLPISAVQVIDNNIFLKLDRSLLCNSVINKICNNGLVDTTIQGKTTFSVVNCEIGRNNKHKSSKQMNQLRTNQVCLAIERVLSICNHRKVPRDQADCIIKVGCPDKKHLKQQEKDIPLTIGTVNVNSFNNTANEYCEVMDVYNVLYSKILSIAQERDALGSQSDLKKRAKLAAASELQFLLLSKNLNRPLTLPNSENDMNAGSTSSDSCFILYNFARINQLLYSYKCQRDKYGDMLPISEVDFSHLREQEEWDIVFNCLIHYQDLITGVSKLELCDSLCFEQLNKILGKICLLLTKLSNMYSKYYRRVKILKHGPQVQSTKQTLNARLYLLLAIQSVYAHSFNIIDIQGMDYM